MRRPAARPLGAVPHPRSLTLTPPSGGPASRASATLRGRGPRQPVSSSAPSLGELSSPLWPSSWGAENGEALTFHAILFEKEEEDQRCGKEKEGQPRQDPALVDV